MPWSQLRMSNDVLRRVRSVCLALIVALAVSLVLSAENPVSLTLSVVDKSGAAIAGAIGTGLAIAATRDAYAYDPGYGYYGGGPVYYDSGPVYYGGDSYIGPRPFYRCGGPYQSAHGGQGNISTCY